MRVYSAVLLSVFLSVGFSFPILAQTSFTGAVNTEWSVEGNWSNGLPAIDNDATIPAGKTVLNSGDAEIENLFAINNFGTFNNGSSVKNKGTITNNVGATIVNSGTFLNLGTLINCGTLQGSFSGIPVLSGSQNESGVCVVLGCTDSTACNYDSNATEDDDSCEAPDLGYDCSGNCTSDENDNGVCDDLECIDENASQFPFVTFNHGCLGTQVITSCSLAGEFSVVSVFANTTYTFQSSNPADICVLSDGTGIICAASSGPVEFTTEMDGFIRFYVQNENCEPESTCRQKTFFLTGVTDTDGDGVCDSFEVVGCQDSTACNYDASATESGVDCVYPSGCEICSGETDGSGTILDNDSDNDGVCNQNEVIGCDDNLACNYNDSTTDSTLACLYAADCDVCSGEEDGTGTVIDNDEDNDGVCNADEVEGCQDEAACNYNSSATDDGDTCLLPVGCEGCSGETDGSGTVVDDFSDADGDGICDGDEIAGCQDDSACNYNSSATDDGVSCVYAAGDCDVCSGATDGTGTVVDNDTDNDGVCNSDEVTGCQDDTACNYKASATDDGATCVFVDGVCESCSGATDGTGTIVDNDTDNDGVCNSDEVAGCQDDTACNYNASATDDGATCVFVDGVCESCSGATDGTGTIVDNDTDNDGVCNSDEVAGCQDDTACNYNASATDDGATCVFVDGVCESCSGATDGTGTIVDNDTDNDGVCNSDEVTGCRNSAACNYNTSATDDGATCVFVDGVCESCSGATDGTGTIVDNDTDNDGVCNSDEVTGCQDDTACNYNTSATDDGATCVFVDGVCESCSGATDGTGTIVDNDTDNDGVCNSDEVAGCQDSTACNYKASATDDGATCVFVDGVCESCSGATDGTGTIVDNDTDNDGVCNSDEVAGCQDDTACNYNASATEDGVTCVFVDGVCESCSGATDGTGTIVDNDTDNDGVCNSDEVAGCRNSTACNYNASATEDGVTCLFVDGVCEFCSGATDGTGTIVDNDTDNDGVCNSDEVTGCQDSTACNYKASATDDGATCVFVDGVCESCSGATDGTGTIVDNDTDNDGVCNSDEVAGCQDDTACNYNASATEDGVTCVFVDGVCESCSGATDGTGTIVDNDTDNDGVCNSDEVAGCRNSTACNYNASATEDGVTCLFVDGVCESCSGATDGTGTIVDNDTDNDGVCNSDEVTGCQDSTACNYKASATDDGATCVFVDGVCESCSGATDGTGTIVDNDTDNDGVCNSDEVTGCQDSTACNYKASATDDGATCVFVDGVCESCSGATDGTGTIVDNDTDNDGVCNSDEVTGCQDSTACNYKASATDDGATCVFVDGICESCSGATDGTGTIVDNDTDNDGVCNSDEVAGCQDSTACNYKASATDDGATCVFVDGVCESCSGATDGTGTIVDNDTDNDGVCNSDEVTGCQDSTACNYKASATDDGATCVFVDGVCESCSGATDGTGTIVDNDTDNDGVCNSDEVTGCQDDTACNYNASATEDGVTCVFVDGVCESCSGATDGTGTIVDNDTDNDGVCNSDEVTGCQDSTACNYDASATDDGATCVFVDGVCESCSGATDGTGTIVDNDTDNDGVCNSDEVTGCQDDTACNYKASATDDGATCVFVDGVCESCSGATDGTGTIVDNDSNNDGICDSNVTPGCQDESACNYDSSANQDDGSCTYPGCMSSGACNFDSNAGCDNSSCVFQSAMIFSDFEHTEGGNGNNDDDDDDDDDNNGASGGSNGYTNGYGTSTVFWSIWNEGGSDCRLAGADASFATSGTRCVRLRDGSSTSNMTTDDLAFSNFEVIAITFNFQAQSMESGESFHLEYSTDGGESFSTTATYVQGVDFSNNVAYEGWNESISAEFTDVTQFRFRNDGSNNNDFIYLDDIYINGCVDGSSEPCNTGDSDGDGVCDDSDLCTDTNACNYDAIANEACQMVDACGICGGINGTYDADEVDDPTALIAGDIAITALADDRGNNKNESMLGFVLLRDIGKGTVIHFTSNEWNGTDWRTEHDERVTWTANQSLSAGQQVILNRIDDNDSYAECLILGCATNFESGGVSDADYIRGGTNVGAGTLTFYGGGVDFWSDGAVWIYQEENDVPQHLYVFGDDLGSNGNTGVGTLIGDDLGEDELDEVFSFEYTPSNTSQFVLKQESRTAESASGALGFFEEMNDESQYDFHNDPNKIKNISDYIDFEVSNAANTITISNGGSTTSDIVVINSNSSVFIAEESDCDDIKLYHGNFYSCDGQSRTLKVKGDISRYSASATFNGGQGTMELDGTEDQEIDAGNSTAPDGDFAFKNLKIKEGKKVGVKGHVKMKSGGSLEFEDNVPGQKIEMNTEFSSSLTLQSNATGTASIGSCTVNNFGLGFDQAFTFERFIPADTDNSWINIGAYVTGTTVADWTTGVSGMLLFEYNETSYGSQSAGWNYLWNGADELTPGNGYMALIPAGVSGTISVTGKFEMGDVTLPLTFTDDPNQSNETVDGWNMVSNPYPAPVNMISVLAHAENADVTSYYLFDNTGAGSYVETLANGTGDAPSTLDVGQSIWVKVNQNTSITFKESDKVVGTSGTFVREFDPSFQGSIGVGIANYSEQWAHAFVRFDEAATTAFIPSEDALHLNTEVHSDLRVWMEAENGEHLSIQSAGSLENTPFMPLHVTSGVGGDVVFSLLEQEVMPADVCAVIEDTETGARAQLGMDPFVVNLPANTLYEERFVLHFNAMPSMALTSTVCDGLDVTELEGEWDAWSLTWSSDDGSATGEGMPYELANGEYTFMYALPSLVCANEIEVEVNAACLGDFNLNGERDIIDLLFLLAGLPGNNGAANLDFETADCDCDGVVTVLDMLTFLTVFASQCD